MRILGLAVILLLAMVSGAAAQSDERVIFDAPVRVAPGEDAAACIGIEPGVLSVQTAATGETPLEPVQFHLYGYRGLDRDTDIAMTVTRAESATTATVTGGLYCFSVVHQLPAEMFTTIADRMNHAQLLTLRMTIQPISP